MNIHPLLVHFPIAFLVGYAGLEIISFVPRIKMVVAVDHIKAFLVIVGTVFAFVTLSTGETAQHAMGRVDTTTRSLIEKHSTFANISCYIFLVIALFYLLKIFRETPIYQKLPAWARSGKEVYYKIFNHQWLLAILAIVGLTTITITGGLGGAIVYGANVDPIVNFIYHLFF